MKKLPTHRLLGFCFVATSLVALTAACTINIGGTKPRPTVTVTASPQTSSPTTAPGANSSEFPVPGDLRINDSAEETAFTTPSGNITCAIFAFDGPAELRCDITNHSWKAPAPTQACDGDWGSSITLMDQAAFGCISDTVFGTSARGTAATWWWGRSSADSSVRVYDQVLRALPVGVGIQRAPFQCVSITGGVDCRNMRSGGRFVVTESEYSFVAGS